MPAVVIVGAGVVGTSIAFHLARSGCRDVLVQEKHYIGSGSTERCPGGIRQQFATEPNIRLSLESVRFFERFEEETGQAADFRQHGYLMLATSQATLSSLRQNVNIQRRLGIDVGLLEPEQVSKMVPGLNIKDVAGAAFCDTDGYADPYSVVSGFASVAKRLGVRIQEETEVIGIDIAGEQVDGVHTTKGSVAAPAVVIAAGPWSGIVARKAGIDVPMRPSRRHIFFTESVFSQKGRFGELARLRLPMVVDYDTGFWFRREGLCIIFGMRNPEESEGFSLKVDWDFFTDTLAETACHRLPFLRDAGIGRGQAGLHSDTPDNMAIIGEVPGVSGLFLACGFSGHGFMHAPAVGRLVSDLILERNGAVAEATPFRIDRFRREISTAETAFI
jgi:sarcosine oxidase subunit beta